MRLHDRRPLVLALVLAAALPAAAEELARPASLEPAVRFWTRVYTEVDSRSGLIHDTENLAVVYEVVRFPEGLSRRARERRTERAKDEVRDVLRALAAGKRSGLSREEQRVLALWPEGVSNATLRRASRNLRFQLGQADRFRDGLVRSGAWRDHIEATLEKKGVPEELVALPHVESSYNPRAYSRIGAAGMWQFTRSTGRMFLRIDNVVDERLDPWLSTDAAARLLARNREITGSWPLAITAYNHGAAGMRRAVRRLGTDDIGEIVRRYRSRTFGFASRNFYASFLAAAEIDARPERYFGPLRFDRPLEYSEIRLPWYTPADSLASALGVDLGTLREHNLALRPAVWSGSKHLPRSYVLRVPKAALSEPAGVLVARVPASERLARQHRDRYHKVRRGEALSTIARRYGVRESELVALNNLRSRHRIRAGQVLVLPGGANAPVQVARQPLPEDGTYRVRRGDNLSIIARRFGVSAHELARENALPDRHLIAVGQELRIPGAAPTAVVASAGPLVPVPSPEQAQAAAEDAVETQTAPVVTSPAEAPDAGEDASASDTAADAATGDADDAATTDATDIAEAPDAGTAQAEAEAGEEAEPDPSDYAVHGDHIVVQAAETLGHYAEWLELRASQLRRLNGMRYGEPVVIGSRLRLGFDRVTPEEFERRRLEHHQILQNEFFDAFEVTGTERHVLQRGESLWYLAKRRYRVPVWLLRQYNPDLDFAALPAGAAMVVPVVEERRG